MSKQEKLIRKFKNQAQVVTWEELKKMLIGLGFKEIQGNGSRVKFINESGIIVNLHKPHPQNEIKSYVRRQVLDKLRSINLL